MPVTPRISRDYAYILSNDQTLELAMDYTNFLLDEKNAAWDMFIVTIMFNHVETSNENRKFIMASEVHRIYEVLASRLFRDPYSPSQYERLPRWVLFADHSPTAVINGSVHFQGLGIFHPFNRQGEPIMVLVEWLQVLLRGEHGLVAHVHLERVTRTPETVQQYVAKTVLNRKSSLDDVIVLPKSRDEYRKRGSMKKPIVRQPQVLRLPQNLEPTAQGPKQPPKTRVVHDHRKVRTNGKRSTF